MCVLLLFLDEKKQKSTDRTELAKNPKLTLKSFNSTLISGVDVLAGLIDISKGDRFLTCSESSPERFLNALTADFLNANSVMSGKLRPSILRLRSGQAPAQDERDFLAD